MPGMAEPQPAGWVPAFELRHRLALALEVAGLSREDIASELDVHRNTISNYLNGKTAPTRAVLIAWSLRTGVPLQWLASGEWNDPDDGFTATGPATSRETHGNPDNVLRIAA